MDIQVNIINAFSIDNTGGNPAGVVWNADALSSAARQQLATQLGFPETAFVSAARWADIKLDFFTPEKQIPHCGHATIAVFSYLRQKGFLFLRNS
jgi:PhzF family phenazine biosynthesis protein